MQRFGIYLLALLILTNLNCKEEPKPENQDLQLLQDGELIPDSVESAAKTVDLSNLNWRKLQSNQLGFSLQAPQSLLSEEMTPNGLQLLHAIPYEHPDPCDERGFPDTLSAIADFDVTFRVVPKELPDAVAANETEFFVSYYMPDRKLTLDPGFIDTVSVGSLHGFQIFSSAHGCGELSYYFPLGQSRTLHVKRKLVPELSAINADRQTYLNLPGVIKPEQEEAIFKRILTSFQPFEDATLKTEKQVQPQTTAKPAQTATKPTGQRQTRPTNVLADSRTYQVIKVRMDDVLNMRSGAGTQNQIVGTIPPDGGNIRIVGGPKPVGSSNWVEVEYGSQRGWVNRRYLELEVDQLQNARKR